MERISFFCCDITLPTFGFSGPSAGTVAASSQKNRKRFQHSKDNQKKKEQSERMKYKNSVCCYTNKERREKKEGANKKYFDARSEESRFEKIDMKER